MLIEVDEYDEALALAYEAGWTDGLPVVPTTAARVAFLDASGRSVDDWPITCLQAGVWAAFGGAGGVQGILNRVVTSCHSDGAI
jgi:hypothetical protein